MSCHSPFNVLHGILNDWVPMLIILFIISYFNIWLGSDILCQNLSASRTVLILLFVAPNLHLSLNERYSPIFSTIS